MITEQEFISRTLSPTEQENRRTVAAAEDAYRRYVANPVRWGDLLERYSEAPEPGEHRTKPGAL